MAKIQGADVKTEAELITAGATASSLINDSQIYVSALALNKTLDDAIIDGDIGGAGGSSGIIVGDDSDLDVDVGAWLAYADAAGVQPVDGTGGSPVLTVTRTTTTPLHGAGSLLLTKDAANRQGNGASLLKTVEPKFRGKPLKFSFVYEASANFSFASQASDVQVFLYDVTNSQLLQPNPIFLDGSGYYAGSVQLPTNCASIRAILHVATVNALAWTFEADDFDLDLNANEFVGSLSDSATVTGFTSRATGVLFATTLKAPSNNLFTISTAGSETRFIANAKCNAVVSFSAEYTAASAVAVVIGWYNSSNVLKATAYGCFVNANSARTSAPLSVEMQPGDYVRVESSVNLANNTSTNFSITGTTSDSAYAHPAAIGLNAQAIARYQTAAGQTIPTTTPTIVNYGTVVNDSLGEVTVGAGWRYTAKTPGWRRVSAAAVSATAQTAATHLLNLFKNGSSYSVIGKWAHAPSGGSYRSSLNGSDVVYLNYGDFIDIRYEQNSGGSISLSTTAAENYISIDKLGSELQPYAPRIAYLKDVKAANTAGGTFTSGAFQTRTLNTLEGDTSFVSLASNQFTLQPGTYDIEAEAPGTSSGGVNLGTHKAKLRNITDSSDTLIGSSATSQSGDAAATLTTLSTIVGRFSITSTKVFEIQHRCEVTLATLGFGRPSNFGVSEIYTQVKITKIL